MVIVGEVRRKNAELCVVFFILEQGFQKCKQKGHNKRHREEYKEHQNMFKILLRMPRRNEKRHKAHKK